MITTTKSAFGCIHCGTGSRLKQMCETAAHGNAHTYLCVTWRECEVLEAKKKDDLIADSQKLVKKRPIYRKCFLNRFHCVVVYINHTI